MKSIHEYKRAFITASNVILVCLFALFLSPSYLHAQVNYSTYPYCSPTTFVQTDVGGTTGGSGTNFGKGPTQYTKSALMACGYINSEITSDHYAALNTQDYAAAQGCGACALVMNGSHATTVMVVDECPSSSNMPCVNGTHHIDLGNGAYSDLQVSYPNPVSWCLVACPAALRNIDNGTGNISYEYKSASAGNAGWHPIHFLDMLYPLVSVSVGTSSGGPFSALSRDSGTDNIPNYWGGKAGQPDNSTGPFWYVLKDGPGNSVTINVGSISPSESTVPYGAGGVQFPANCSTGPTNTFTKTPTVGSPTNTPTRTFTVTPTPTFTPLSGCKYNIYDGDTGTTNLAAGSTFGTNVTITESTTTPHSGTDSMQLAFNWPSGYFAGMGWNWAKYAAASPKILNINNFTELEFWIRATTGAPVTNMTVTLADYGGAGAG